MHRASESIGKIAAALALAQRQLQNPEKSQIATLPTSTDQPRSFRYASLAAGLDIIRKALGEHEIAVLQSTAMDKELGLIRLSTVLAHSSGEWIASDWPVCATTEVNNPHRLGAALTYARRYTLFTIVGIAGEDDVDAPDLQDAAGASPSKPGNPRQSGVDISPAQSAVLRDQLLAELEPLKALDDLTVWTLRRLSLKRRLLQADTEQIDQIYLAKLDQAGTSDDIRSSADLDLTSRDILPLRKTVRRRSREHLAFVASQPCMICKRTPCDAHHLKFAQPRALGKKVSDEYTVPLCREHHSELHRHGNERAWWVNAGLAPLEVATELWDTSQQREADGLKGSDLRRHAGGRSK